MALLKANLIIDDEWTRIDDDAAIVPNGPVIVSLARWQRDRAALISRLPHVGLMLRSDQPPTDAAGDIARFGLIALEFPKFTDGRAYSYARLIRERYGFTGELRAVGNVLRDQLGFMQRCGFDAYEIPDGADARAWTAAFGEISVRYQRAADRATTAIVLRRETLETRGAFPDGDSVVGMWAY